MDCKKIALFSDLDGTLFDSRTVVHSDNSKAISRFVEAGGMFSICTGRTQRNAALFLDGVRINGPCIVHNGSAVYSYGENRFLRQHFLPNTPVQEFLGRVLQELPRLNVQVYPSEDICFVSPEELADPQFVCSHQPCSFTPLDRVATPWLKALIMGSRQELELAADFGQQLLDKQANLVFSSPVYLEVLPWGISKGSALKEISELTAVQGRVTVAIGDFYNDIELLQAADIAIAPENAVPEVKALAQHLVCTNDRGAVADLIDRFFPQL